VSDGFIFRVCSQPVELGAKHCEKSPLFPVADPGAESTACCSCNCCLGFQPAAS